MTAADLIRTVEEQGGRFVIDGDRLGIFPADVAATLVEELRAYKLEIINLISSRAQMPPGVRLVSWQLPPGPVRLNRYSTVTDTDLFIRTSLVQLEHRLAGHTWLSGNWSLTELLDRLERCGCIVQLEDTRKVEQ
jgi:hypothetical protein